MTTERREENEDDRNDTTVTLDDVLAVLGEVPGPVVTTTVVAEALDCPRETAGRKLRALEDRNHLETRTTAGADVWWRAEPRDEPTKPRDEPTKPRDEPTKPRDEPTKPRDDQTHEIDPDDPFWDLEPGSSGETDVSTNVDDILYGDST